MAAAGPDGGGRHEGRRHHRHAELHGPGADCGRPPARCPDRHLWRRLRGILAPDGPAGVRRHVRDEGHDASSRDAADSTVRSLPPGLDAVVLTCLEKDPDHRPQTTDGLAERLVSCGAGQPWSAEHAHAWWGEHAPSPSGAPWTGEQRLLMPSLAEPWSG